MCFPALRHLHVLKLVWIPAPVMCWARKNEAETADSGWYLTLLWVELRIFPSLAWKLSASVLSTHHAYKASCIPPESAGLIWANCELTSRLSLDSFSASQSSQPWMIPAISFIQQPVHKNNKHWAWLQSTWSPLGRKKNPCFDDSTNHPWHPSPKPRSA